MILSIMMPLLMAVELMGSALIFTASLKKKPNYLARIAGSYLACLLITFWVEVFYIFLGGEAFDYFYAETIGDSIFKFVFYVAIFIMIIGCIKFSYDGSIWNILLCCAGAYVTQHIAVKLVTLVGFIEVLSFDMSSVMYYVVYYAVFAVVYILAYLVFVKNRVLREISDTNIRRKVFSAMIAIFICIGLSRFTSDDETRSQLATFAESIYAIVSCALVLSMVYDGSKNEQMKSEVEFLKELIHREREQYEIKKENIELINIKCHDLKHQILSLHDNYSEKQITEVSNAIMIYDSMIKTGNDVLDVILTEKTFFCQRNGITLTFVVNGKDLLFMDDMDVYSLFGNAVSNAIEAVINLEEKEKRCISITAKMYGEFLQLHVENYFEGNIKIVNGFPITTKDSKFHGFGIKSMEMIAKDYHGSMTATVKNDKFFLDFVFSTDKKIGKK